MIQRIIKCLGQRAALLAVLLGLSCFVMKESFAKEVQLTQEQADTKIYRPGYGPIEVKNYKPNYSKGDKYQSNNIDDLFKAIHFANPTLGHTYFPDNPAIGEPYDLKKQSNNKTIREYLTSVGSQAEKDAMNMIGN